jgi:hypothetical protein
VNNSSEIREIKESINGFVGSLERLKALLGKSMEAYSLLQTKAPVVNAFHEVQVCTGQNIDALLKLDMVLQDLLDERAPE